MQKKCQIRNAELKMNVFYRFYILNFLFSFPSVESEKNREIPLLPRLFA